VPWALYQSSGDVGVLRTQYDSMRRWIDFVIRAARPDRLWEWVVQLGDWLDPAAPPDKPWAARTDPHLVANAWFCRMLLRMEQTAELLGEAGDAVRYAEIGDAARSAFRNEYVTPNGRMMSDSETSYALAVHFDLLPDAQRGRAAARLVELVRASEHHITTGFAGTPIIADALCDAGAVATAYALLLQEEAPSWLYPVINGATTIWERWDSLRPDGSVNPGEMNSFNHYALGSVADWLHRSVAGLAPGEPGYRMIRVRPLPGPGLTMASARHDTPYGPAEVSWRLYDDQIELTVVVPPNATADVLIPGGDEPLEVGSGIHNWNAPFTLPDPSPKADRR
jgi:alpha-L-rhamnosidase